LERFFSGRASAVVALEAGTHSAWIGRLLEECGHRVVVANPRHVRAIWDRDRKSDVSDAEMLARLVRVDPTLLHPIRLRSETTQADQQTIKVREGLVRTRTRLINQVRGLAKSAGYSLVGSTSRAFVPNAREGLSGAIVEAMEPLLAVIEATELQIRALDRKIQQIGAERYPVTARLRQVAGVGPLTSLAYVLAIEDPTRFRQSREVGPYLGLVPRRDQSGETDKQLSITKTGNRYLRCLLVSSAQYIMGPFAPPSALRAFGFRLAERGGKNAKRRAAVAVARKLAVLLHALWVSDAPYDPNHGVPSAPQAA